MACDSRENSIKYLVKSGIISDTREILDIDKFNITNVILTEHAKTKYGLNPGDSLLFTVSRKEHVIKPGKVRDATRFITRAEPDLLLFDTLDQLIDYKEAQEANQRPEGINESLKEVKEGVAELFDSNPELANAVYESLGFNQMITPNDKVVFGHPTIGKSFLKKQGEDKFITLDDDYANEVNAFVDTNRGSETRQEYKGRKPKEYNEFMLNLYDRLKAQAKKENKILFVSNTNILKERMSDFDKVITIPKEEFKRRFDERGATYGFEDWKSDIDATVAKVPNNKVINTTGYLADLFITPQQKQQAQQLYSQYLDTGKQDIEGFKKFVSGAPMFMRTPEVDYSLKLVTALMNLASPKETKRTRKYGEKTEPERLTIRLNTKEKPYLEENIRKTLNNKGVTNQQVDFVFDYMKSNNIQEISTSDLAVAIATDYSFTVEINLSTEFANDRGDIPYKQLEQLNKGIVPEYFSVTSDFDGLLPKKENIFRIPSGKIGLWKNEEYDDKIQDLVAGEEQNIHGVEFWRLKDEIANKFLEEYKKDLEIEIEKKESNIPRPTQNYSNLTVPGGTNYTEQEIATPAITPSIKGHASFATNKGIGWFRSDDQTEGGKYYPGGVFEGEMIASTTEGGTPTKTRRILEVQSDLFQKGRDKKDLTAIENIQELPSKFETFDDTLTIITTKENNKWYEEVIEYKGSEYEQTVVSKKEITSEKAFNNYYNIIKEEGINKSTKNSKNQFLQLLNKDNNWVTFFIKSIIQDSAKKGYEKVLFPSGNTASKVEGHTTLEEFKKQKENRIKELETELKRIEEVENSDNWFALQYKIEDGRIKKINSDSPAFTDTNVKTEEEAKEIVLRKLNGRPSATFTKEKKNNEINQLKQELERVDREGFGALRPIFNFYENTVANILKKQGYSPRQVADEYGNTWNEIAIEKNRDLSSIMFMREQNPKTSLVDDVLSRLDNAKALKIAETMADRLSLGLGISYQVINKDTAIKILENSPIKYNGEPAFVYGNTVYIIEGNLNLNSVLHEFAHPLISAIRATPATRKLFENLYGQVSNTIEGQAIIDKVKKLYPELVEGTVLFKEEVIVHALQQRAYNIVNNQVESEGFDKFIKNLLYAIKQILRNLFGPKIKVSELDVNTTLDELADMLISDQFDLEGVMSKKEFPQFLKSEKQRIDKLDNTAKKIANEVSADAMIKIINIFYSNVISSINQKRRLKKSSPEYKMLEKTILEEETNEYLPKVKELLQGYQTIRNTKGKSRQELVDDALLSDIERLEYLTRQSTSVIHSFNTINNISESLLNDLVEIKKNKNLGSRSVMTLVSIYQNLIAGWQDLVYNTDQTMVNDFGMTADNPFAVMLGSINTNLTRANTVLKQIYKESSVNFYKEYTGYMHEFIGQQLKSNLLRSLKRIKQPLNDEEIEDFYNKIIDDNLTTADMEALVQRGANKKFVQDFIDDYNTFKIDENKIRDLLSGKTEDVNWFNRFLEAYTSSNDPIVGGLAIYFQNVRTDAMNQALQESERFRSKLGPALDAVGFNKLSTRQLLNLVTFKDNIGIFNDKDEIVEHQVYTFHHGFKNYRFDERVLENSYEKARETGDPIKIAEAARQLRKWRMDYMWDFYLPEVYEADELFESEIGKLAWLDRQTILDKFKTETSKYQDELERFEKYSTAQALMKEYRQLFELTYVDGSPKIDDPANGIYDLSKAMILKEYREKTRKYKTFIPKEKSLQTSYNQFANLIVSQNIKRDSKEFDEKITEWEKQNLRKAYSEQYLENRKADFERLRELNAKMSEGSKAEYDISGAYEEIFSLMFLNRDEQGQPVPSELGPDKLKRIKELEQEIYEFKSSFDNKIGLTKQQLEELKRYEARIDAGTELSSLEKKRYISLLEKQTSGLTPSELTELNGIYSRISETSIKIPTEYYLDTLNYYLNKLGQSEVNADNVDKYINSPEFLELIYEDDAFKKWFINSHIEKEVFDKGKFVSVRQRTMAYSITIPADEEDILTTTIIDETTGKEVTFKGIPNSRHTKYVVKDEFRTIPRGEDWENYIGIYKDPAGNWLPRQYNPGTKTSAVDSKYINEDYLKMKGTPQYKLIELIKEFMVDIQKELALSSRSGYDMPRFFLDNKLEMLQGTNFSEVASQVKASVKTWIDDNFRNSQEAEFERSHNFNPKQLLVSTDLLGQEISYVPIRGVYRIELDKVSPDVIRNIFRYQASAILQTKLIESSALVEGILETLDDPANAPKDLSKADKAKFKMEGVLESISKSKDKTYNRREQVRSLLLRELQGRNVVGIEESNPWLFKLTNYMQKTAGIATLAVNIPSDLKNRYGQIVQNIIEASGGQFINLKSLALGKVYATKTMIEWSSKGIYAKGNQSLSVQIVQAFDPAFKTSSEYGKSVGRSMIKDLIDGSWMYDFRKFGEFEAALQLFGGFMHHKYIDQKTSNGTIIPIRYIDAWELDEDGVMKLKDGIDPEWGTKQIYHTYVTGQTLQEIADKYFITVEDLKAKNQIKDEKSLENGQELVIAKGVKFKQFKNKFQAVSRQLYGNYDEFGQPEGNMYLAYRMFFFMRKWATTGFLKRFGMSTKKGNWGGKRYDWALGQPTRGYYITSFVAGYKLIKSWGDYYNYMDDQDKADVKRMISEGFTTLFFAMAALLIFGYDDDDEDRFQKLAEKSGPMFTPDFRLRGFVSNHLLYLMLGVYQETSTFAPIPGLGLDDYSKFLSVTSTAFNSTIKIYMKIFEDVVNMIMLNDSAYYKRDVGPYSWQKEGSAKIITHFLSAFGLSGRSADPETLVENMEKYGRI